MKHLVEKVKKEFKIFTNGASPDLIIKAPGRINLIGEHTDYNEGLVFPAAIDKCFVYAFKINNTDCVNVKALDIEETFQINIKHLKKTEYTWANFLVGLLIQITKKHKIQGFDCVMSSDIPIGSGLSSSSALECGFIGGVNSLFQFNLQPWEMIAMSHKSNHDFLGVKGGVMDQFSSFFGKKENAMILDCRDQTFEYKPVILDGYSIVLINTKVTHDHVTGNYNKGPQECQQAVNIIKVKHPHIKSLRDVSIDMIEDCQLPKHLASRAVFVLQENNRVLAFADALETNNLIKIGTLLYQSHEGLKNQYLVSCSELDLLVELTKDIPQVVGSRMMGGGFGGCTINIIEEGSATQIVDDIMTKYKTTTGIKPEAYFVQISNGVEIIED